MDIHGGNGRAECDYIGLRRQLRQERACEARDWEMAQIGKVHGDLRRVPEPILKARYGAGEMAQHIKDACC